MSSASLEDVFTYHAPFGTQQARYLTLREAAKGFARLITTSTPASREQSVALTNVQQAVMWANAAIAINEKAPKDVTYDDAKFQGFQQCDGPQESA